MKLDHGLIVLDDQMLCMELRTLWKNLRELGERTFYEGLFAKVVTGQGVAAHHCPINVVDYVLEESSAVAVFKSLEDFANAIGCNSHLVVSSCVAVHLLRVVSDNAIEPTLQSMPL
jgi:hypothetical protein